MSCTLEFKTKKEAASNNFASILFEDQNVKSVFIGKDFVTITKKKLIGTQLNQQFCQKFLNFFLLENQSTLLKKSVQKKENYNDEDLKIVEQIKKLIDERVKPAVAQDGGDISFVKFDSGKVF